VLDANMARDLPKADVHVCMYCGQLLTHAERACPSCGSRESAPAVATGPELRRHARRVAQDSQRYAHDA
jgi:RNA polymerase subunit RPABC4/transcription elongation factor Spt4